MIMTTNNHSQETDYSKVPKLLKESRPAVNSQDVSIRKDERVDYETTSIHPDTNSQIRLEKQGGNLYGKR